jgi:hypothetical protein
MTTIESNNPTPINANGLTDDQAEAARTLDRYQAEGSNPTALLGYAGTGKTELTIQRIKHIAENWGESKQYARILVIAPTHKARRNLWNKARDRIHMYAPGYSPLKVSTELAAKAIKNPNRKDPWYQVDFATVAKALNKKRCEDRRRGITYFGLPEYEDEDGNIYIDPKALPAIEGLYTHCFIDEVSMVGKYDWDLIQRCIIPFCHTEVVGDPAQLPPVNDGAESPAFQIPHKYTLTDVVRNEGGILKNSFIFRNAQQRKSFSIPFIKEYDNVTPKDWEEWIDKYIELHNVGYDCRAITYRNKERAKLNKLIRSRIQGTNVREFEPGDKITAINTCPLSRREDAGLRREYDIFYFSMYSTQEGTVETVQRCEYQIQDAYRNPDCFHERFTSFPRNFDHSVLYYWFLEVRTDEGKLVPVRQICPESREDLQRVRDTLKTWINQARKHQEDNKTTRKRINDLNIEIANTDDPKEIEKLKRRRQKFDHKLWFQGKDQSEPFKRWMTIPEEHGDRLIELNDFFHQIQYSFAITAHKSQGSTYDYAFIYSDDLSNNENKKECLQLLYVAVTRPSLGIYFTDDGAPKMLTEEESESFEQEENPDDL